MSPEAYLNFMKKAKYVVCNNDMYQDDHKLYYCTKCGEEVWVPGLFEDVAVKYCVKCAPDITEN